VKGGEKSFMVGLAAICYALWRSRNSTRFGKKLFHRRRRSFALPHLLSLQVRVQGAEDRTGLEAGAEALKNTAMMFHHPGATSEDTRMVLSR